MRGRKLAARVRRCLVRLFGIEKPHEGTEIVFCKNKDVAVTVFGIEKPHEGTEILIVSKRIVTNVSFGIEKPHEGTETFAALAP